MNSTVEKKAGAGKIRSLSASDSRLILATQQFPDPHKVISALLENSLDAGASEIAIILEGVGIKSITVNDNGGGIDMHTLQALGTCRVTTANPKPGAVVHKGESIFLIAALGTVLVTSSMGDDPYERVVSEDTSTVKHTTRVGKGTSIIIRDLYGSVPVRQKYFTSQSPRKKLLLSIMDMVQSYALAKYTMGFRLVIDEVIHVDVRQSPQNSIHDRYTELFGRDFGSLVRLFSLETRLGYDVKASLAGPDTGITKQSKLGHARKIFISANGKPVLCPLLTDALQQTYTRISATHIPIGALNLTLPPGTYALARSMPYDTLQMQGLDVFVGLLSEEYLAWLLRHDKSASVNVHVEPSTTTIRSYEIKGTKRLPAAAVYSKSKPKPQLQSQQQDIMSVNITVTRASHTKAASFFHTQNQNTRSQQLQPSRTNVNIPLCPENVYPALGSVGCSELQDTVSNPEPSNDAGLIKPEPHSCESEDVVRVGPVRRRGKESGFRQSDFINLRYIGQYNQSFLLAQLNNTFFLIDQHAAHEAKNFADYWYNPHCYLSKQKTIAPLRLELRPDERLCLEEFLPSTLFDIIGFELSLSGSHAVLSSFPSLFGQVLTEEDFRDYLLLLYGHTKEYVDSILHDREAKEEKGKEKPKMLLRLLHNNVAPTKIRKIFASKSCKASVRLGDPLLDSTAKHIISNLAHCEKPFNCPHGRPVLRFLSLTSRLNSIDKEQLSQIEESRDEIIDSED